MVANAGSLSPVVRLTTPGIGTRTGAAGGAAATGAGTVPAVEEISGPRSASRRATRPGCVGRPTSRPMGRGPPSVVAGDGAGGGGGMVTGAAISGGSVSVGSLGVGRTVARRRISSRMRVLYSSGGINSYSSVPTAGLKDAFWSTGSRSYSSRDIRVIPLLRRVEYSFRCVDKINRFASSLLRS